MGVYGTRSIIVPIASLASYRKETARWVSFHYLHDLLQVRQLENDILRSKGFHLVHILFNVGIHFDNFHTCPYLLPEQLLASSDDRNKNRSRVCGGGGTIHFGSRQRSPYKKWPVHVQYEVWRAVNITGMALCLSHDFSGM